MGSDVEELTSLEEFEKFHSLLLQSAPSGFTPIYIPIEKESKYPPRRSEVDGSRTISGTEIRDAFYDADSYLTYTQAKRRLESGKNVGIATVAEQRLLIIDVDGYQGETLSAEGVPDTLTVTSRSRRGKHVYLFVSREASGTFHHSHDRVTIPGLGVLKWNGGYVLAPGSYVPVESSSRSELSTSGVPATEGDHVGEYTIKCDRPPVRDFDPQTLPCDISRVLLSDRVKTVLFRLSVFSRVWKTLSTISFVRRGLRRLLGTSIRLYLRITRGE